MKKILKTIAALQWAVLLTGCDMLESHPYDVKISGDKYCSDRNVDEIEKNLAGKKSFVFAMISDTQRAYDETVDAVEALNSRDDLDFVVHGGDIAECGSVREMEWTRDILEKLKVPYITVIGNHDCQATGTEAYRKIFGRLNYSFVAGDVKFLCLNTNALDFDYSTAIPDFSFLAAELAATGPEIKRTIALMHAGPFSEQFNNNVAEGFHCFLKRFPGLQFCLYGHQHYISADELFGDGIIYYQCANIKKRSYLLFKIREGGGYEYEVVDF